jgi:hypothetical protein
MYQDDNTVSDNVDFEDILDLLLLCAILDELSKMDNEDKQDDEDKRGDDDIADTLDYTDNWYEPYGYTYPDDTDTEPETDNPDDYIGIGTFEHDLVEQV